MKKRLLILLCSLICHIICLSQVIAPPGADSMSCEDYSGWMTQYYNERLNLNDWQHVQVYEIILEEKRELAAKMLKTTPADKPLLLKRYYLSLDGRLGSILTSDQYQLYQHLNTVKIKTVEVQ